MVTNSNNNLLYFLVPIWLLYNNMLCYKTYDDHFLKHFSKKLSYDLHTT